MRMLLLHLLEQLIHDVELLCVAVAAGWCVHLCFANIEVGKKSGPARFAVLVRRLVHLFTAFPVLGRISDSHWRRLDATWARQNAAGAALGQKPACED